MSIEYRPLATVILDDINALIADKVNESSQIEYKRELLLSTDDQKKEFLADVTAMANTVGGRLFIGIEAPRGIPSAIPGIAASDADSLVLRALNLLRDSVKPPPAGIETRVLNLESDRVVLIFHVPQSLMPPHMITFKGAQRFYARTSNGKHLMEYSEIRTAFLQGATTRDRLDSLRANRLQRVISGNDFRGINTLAPAFLLEIVPVRTLFESQLLDYKDTRTLRAELKPIDSLGGEYTFDFEGFVAFEWDHRTNSVWSYTRLNRSGFISAYSTSLSLSMDGKSSLTSSHFESKIAEAADQYSTLLRRLLCPLPHALVLSLINAKDIHLYRGAMARSNPTYHPIQENQLFSQIAMLVEDQDAAIKIFRPQFDAIWNAFGFPNCVNYDQEGNWAPQR